jgi:hypothetical protein
MYLVQTYKHSSKMSINFHQTKWHHIPEHIKSDRKKLVSSYVSTEEIRHSFMAVGEGDRMLIYGHPPHKQMCILFYIPHIGHLNMLRRGACL